MYAKYTKYTNTTKGEKNMIDEDTSIRIKKSTKKQLSEIGNKGETFNDIIQKTIIKNYCLDPETSKIINRIDQANKRACFYLGVLFGKTYHNKRTIDIPNWDKIKDLNQKNYKKTYTQLVHENTDENGFSEQDNLLQLISAEILNSNDLKGISDDDMNLYYTYGKTLYHHFP